MPTKKDLNYPINGGSIRHTFICGGVKHNVIISDAFMPKGVTFPMHDHKGHEWIAVIEGKLIFTFKGKDVVISAGENIYIEPGSDHICHAVVDTTMYGVTFDPVDEHYPQ